MGQPKQDGILRKLTNWENLYFYQKTVALYQLTYVFVAVGLLCSGCTSWRFTGNVDNWDAKRGAPSIVSKYLLDSLEMCYEYRDDRGNPSVDDVCCVRPDVFTATGSGNEAGTVKIYVYGDGKDVSHTHSLFFFSLSTLPTFLVQSEVFRVKVELDRKGKKSVSEFKIAFDTAAKYTMYSPVALIPYGEADDCLAQRANSRMIADSSYTYLYPFLLFGSLEQPHNRLASKDKKEVLAETIAVGTTAALQKMEKRKAKTK